MFLSDNINTEEIWAPVPGVEHAYEVSTLGRVRSIARQIKCVNGTTISKAGKVLRPHVRKPYGYTAIYMQCGDYSKCNLVHVLVLSAFVGPRPAGHVACHRDGNPRNNSLANLYWGTPAQNSADRYRHGTIPFGERNNRAKLTAAQVEVIRNSTKPQTVLASEFGVCTRAIWAVRTGRTWAN